MDAQEFKNNMLHLAIQGKLLPQNPNDEPASVLLERIKEEKEQLIKDKKIKRNKNESIIFRKNNHFYEKIGKNEPVCIDDLLFEVPKSWELCRLGSICQLLNAPKYENEELNYLEVKYLRGTKEPEIKNKGKIVEKGNTVILVDGENSGEVFTIPERGYLGSTFRILNIPFSVDEKYFLNLIEFYKQLLKENKKGAAIPHLNKEIFNNILIGLPPLNEQKRIVNILNLVDKYVKADIKFNELNDNFSFELKELVLQKAIKGELVKQDPNDEPASILLKRIKEEKEQLIKDKKIKRNKNESFIYRENNHFYEKIGKNEPVCIDDEIPFDIPDSWEWCRLGFIGDWSAGSTPKRGEQKYYENGNIPWLKTGDLNNGIIKDIPEFITETALNECSVRLNPVGSVLIAMYGATIGKVGILGIEATTNQACCACIPLNGIYNKYLFYFLMSQNDAFNNMGEGGAQPNISRTKIINYLLPLPPFIEQQKIVNKVEKLLNKSKI